MNETEAWNRFTQTGRVEDYLRYAKVRGSLPVEVAPSKEGILFEEKNDDLRSGTQGDAPRGERPLGHTAH